MGGTAPDESAWLFVEYAGPWGRKAVAESRLPDDVREFLAGLDGIRVQLVRRHGGVSGPGVRVFTARLGAEPGVWTTVLADVAEVPTLDLARPDADPRLTAYDAPLWLVCTNGRRDLCCAETGRPVAAALAARWPDATWETTHLGGHRFAGTLLALPSGYALGRLDARHGRHRVQGARGRSAAPRRGRGAGPACPAPPRSPSCTCAASSASRTSTTSRTSWPSRTSRTRRSRPSTATTSRSTPPARRTSSACGRRRGAARGRAARTLKTKPARVYESRVLG